MQSFLQLAYCQSVISALEFSYLVQPDPLDSSRDDCLNEGAGRLIALPSLTKRSVLPVDSETDSFDRSAIRISCCEIVVFVK